MYQITYQPTTRDPDGWIEIVRVEEEMDEVSGSFNKKPPPDPPPDPEVVGWLREVAGTETQPTTWFDARVLDPEQGTLERRFPSAEAAVASMACRIYYPPDMAKTVGW